MKMNLKKTAALILILTVLMAALSIAGISAAAGVPRAPAAAAKQWDLPVGIVGQPYQAQALIFDDEDFTRTLTLTDSEGKEGLLPDGLSLNGDGSITGTPAGPDQNETFNIVVSWAESDKTQTFKGFYLEVRNQIDPIAVDESAPNAVFRTDIAVPAESDPVMYRFVAPSTSVRIYYDIEKVDGISLYRANGTDAYSLGLREDGERFRTTAGDTYYIVAANNSDTDLIFTVEPYMQEFIFNPSNTSDTFGNSLEKTGENITQSFADEENETWDVWTFTNTEACDFDVRFGWIVSNGELLLVADYNAYFQNARNANDFGGVSLDEVAYNKPSENANALILNDNETLSCFGWYYSTAYGAPHVKGLAVFSVEIFVPAGVALVVDDMGIIRDADSYVPPSENETVKLSDVETGVFLKGNLPNWAGLSVLPVIDSENFGLVKNASAEVSEKLFAYQISLTNDEADDAPILLDGKVQVAVPTPSKYNYRTSVVYFIADDGTPTKLFNKLDSINKKLIFNTDLFNLYDAE